jgi:hypothetical protein
MGEIRAGGEPLDRLTMLAGKAVEAVEEQPEATGREQVVVLVVQEDPPGGDGFDHGMAHAGFGDGDEGLDAVSDLLLRYAEALGHLTGRVIRIVPVDQN